MTTATDAHEGTAAGRLAAVNADLVRSEFTTDPWVTSGVLRVEDVRPWTPWLDSRDQRHDSRS